MPISGSSPNKSFSRTDGGGRTGSTVWQQSAAAARGIQATDQDYHDNDIATAINACLFRDGGNAITGNLTMGGNKLTGLGAGSTSGDSVEYAQMNTAIAAYFPSGTKLVFAQAAAPTGWTKATTANNAALRVVSGTSGGTYYSAGQTFTDAVAWGSVDGHALTTGEMPSHNHGITDPGHAHSTTSYSQIGGGSGFLGIVSGTTSTGSSTTGISIQNAGSGGTHAHTFVSAKLDVNYVDTIIATKD